MSKYIPNFDICKFWGIKNIFLGKAGGKGGNWESVLKVRFSGDGPVMVMFQSSLFVKKHCNPA
jgi:hypothetical protein